MNREQILKAFIEDLVQVAPDLEPERIGENDHLQDDLDLDSMDVLNLVAALHARFGVDIPEADYTQIATPALATTYLTEKLPPERMSHPMSSP